MGALFGSMGVVGLWPVWRDVLLFLSELWLVGVHVLFVGCAGRDVGLVPGLWGGARGLGVVHGGAPSHSARGQGFSVDRVPDRSDGRAGV